MTGDHTNDPRPIGYDGPMADYWAGFQGRRADRFRAELTDPAVLSAVGDLAGRSVLDVGCGEGYLARTMADRGAKVTGLDLSADLVAIAEARGGGPTYRVGSMLEPLPVPDGSTDVVVANHSWNDVEDLGAAVKHAAAALRPGGRVVALVLHPCFYWHRSGLADDRAWPLEYLTTRPRLQSFNVEGVPSPGQVRAWYRPLSAYVEAIADHGLVVDQMAEPAPSAAMLADPWWSDAWSRPLFLVIRARAV